MAFARVQGLGAENDSSSSTVAVTITAVGSGNAICGIVSCPSGATITSVMDDKGNTYNLETSVVDTFEGHRSTAFSLTNITNAPTVITGTISSNQSFKKIIVDEFSGGSTASSDERDGSAHGGQYQSSPGTGTDGITSGTFTTTNNGDLLWGGCIGASNTTLASNGTSFSTGSSQATSYAGQTEYRVQTTAGSGTAATLTQAGNVGRMTFLIALKAPSAAAASLIFVPNPMKHMLIR